MKKFLILLLIPFTIYAREGRHTAPRHIDITPNKSDTEPPLTLDLDSNIYGQVGNPGTINDIGQTIYVNPTLQYSFNNGIEIEVQSLNIPIRGGGAQNYEYTNYFGISHTKKVGENIRMINGSLIGFDYNYINPGSNTNPIMLQNFSFHDWNYVGENWLIHVGSFFANKALSTTTDYISFMCGFQYTLNNFWRFQGDYVAGHSNVSGALVTTTLLISRNFNFRFGVIVPETNSGNEFAGDVGWIFKF